MVNSSFNSPSRYDITNNLRKGNFYSVRYGDRKDRFPKFTWITETDGKIRVVCVNTSTIRFKSRGNVLKRISGLNMDNIHEATYLCDGSEGYIRIELQNDFNTIAYSQPLFIYGNSMEDLIPFDCMNADVIANHSLLNRCWEIRENGSTYYRFKTREDAEQALDILKHYRIDKIGYVSRKYPLMEYVTINGRAPEGAFPGEDAVTLSTNTLRVVFERIPGTNEWYWFIKMLNNILLINFGDSEIMARRALEIIKRYKFSKVCYVGRPFAADYGMMYFRK